jgi:alpha-glucosidase (family GH31 glycosyl hydrolase)
MLTALGCAHTSSQAKEKDVNDVESEIQGIVDRETRAWDTQDADLLLSVFHPDMVWPWPSAGFGTNRWTLPRPRRFIAHRDRNEMELHLSGVPYQLEDQSDYANLKTLRSEAGTGLVVPSHAVPGIYDLDASSWFPPERRSSATTQTS